MLNFTIGPVQMHDYTKEIGGQDIPYFRTSEFSAVMKENEKYLLDLFKAPDNSKVVFLTGSGTAAMEASIINSFSEKDKLIVINGGSFGQRFVDLCELHEIPFEEIKLNYGESLKKSHLSNFEKRGFTGFLVNLHETSTGVLYDIDLISEFCKRNELFLVVDCISAFLADDFDMAKVGADIAITGSQKALALAPGVSIAVLSEKAVSRATSQKVRCMYLSFAEHLKNMERGQTPFTPAVGTLLEMHERLKRIMSDGGLEAEKKHIKTICEDFRNKASRFGFTLLAENMSNAVTAIKVKESQDAHKIFEILKDEYNIFVCPNGGELASKVFRVGHIGALSIKDNDTLIAALSDMERRGLL